MFTDTIYTMDDYKKVLGMLQNDKAFRDAQIRAKMVDNLVVLNDKKASNSLFICQN